MVSILTYHLALQCLLNRSFFQQVVDAVVVHLNIVNENGVDVILLDATDFRGFHRSLRSYLLIQFPFSRAFQQPGIHFRLALQQSLCFRENIEPVQPVRFEGKLLRLIIGDRAEQCVQTARHDATVL
uniref:Putative secreted protein n=1 Tax=Anopheles darlingi TaxID=43151 RepID=A0A2M4DCP4_ANODA